MRAVILLYHRINQTDADPWGICVSPENFAEHMEVLREKMYPCTLSELARAHEANSIPDDSVVVTFDDGYLDNLTNAAPILEKYGVPATVFVASGGVGQKEEFWWDELERAFFETTKNSFESDLFVEVAGKRLAWGPSDSAEMDQIDQGPTALSAYTVVWKELRQLPPQAQSDAIRKIREWADLPREPRPTHRTLSASQLKTLAACEVISIGAHTVSHPLLPAHSADFQFNEIVGSRSTLEDIVGRPVQHFAYPYGEYNQTAVRILREAGFTCACNSVANAVTAKSRLHELPRVPIKNCNGEQFLRALWERLHQVDSFELEVGQKIAIPLSAFKSQTGEVRGNVIECAPGENEPGHCLFGADFTFLRAGTYRATISLEQHGAKGDIVIDVFENAVRRTTLAELEPDAHGRAFPCSLQFLANKGYSTEFRVFWRGQGKLKITEVSLERTA